MTTHPVLSIPELRIWLQQLPSRTRAGANPTRGEIADWVGCSEVHLANIGRGQDKVSDALRHRLSRLRWELGRGLVAKAGGVLMHVSAGTSPGQPVPRSATIDLAGPQARIRWGQP